jgi:predicted nucleotidyltransferase
MIDAAFLESMTPATLPRSPQTPQTLEERRHAALAVAKQCQTVLQEQFGVEQSIIFGSLAGDAPWHWDSDVDIAVSDLCDRDWVNACEALTAIAPDWLKIDLVRLENVDPEVHDRILQIKPMPQNKYLALKEPLDDELAALEKSEAALKSAVEVAQTIPEEFAMRALATYINDLYLRIERISERVAVSFDGGLPQGANWHQALLWQVADATETRPALWSGSLLLSIDEYRKFRHVVHHKYGDQLKPEVVMALADLAPETLVKMQQAIALFTEWLIQQAQ